MSKIRLVSSQLLQELIRHTYEADSIYLLVSFVMESGVQLLAPHLHSAASRGAEIKILTGDYLYVTQPNALEALYAAHSSIEIRMWNSYGTSFHPKAYLFRKQGGDGAAIVGSSNMSRSALTTGVEWNISVSSIEREVLFDETADRFLHLFYADQTLPVNPVTIQMYRLAYKEFHGQHPDLAKTWSESEALATMLEVTEAHTDQIKEQSETYLVPLKPRPAQLEALHQLNMTREDGYDKALVVMATGLGKTFLAAMFAKSFVRVLFVAHREQILVQAQSAFRAVLPEKSTGLFTGREKVGHADIVFASIFTLGQRRHLSQFQTTHFDLIIVDEFHHAAASTYRSVMNWFKPQFMLGITATPDRADGHEVYGLCDGNVAYKIEFLDAIQRGWLSPFQYYGIYDDTDYSQIRWLGTKYDEQELRTAQTRESMASVVLDAWNKHKQTRGIAFCSSVAQALFLSNYFLSRDVRCVCLHGGSSPESRAKAIEELTSGEKELIFTVDLFNEGVDIPSVDTLLFVRPTESLTVFTQQIGRGLRIHPDKSHCAIIDLIGNYRNADLKFAVLDAVDVGTANSISQIITFPSKTPSCTFHLDLRVVDLIRAMQRKKQPRKERLKDAYQALKIELGRRPLYLEMHLQRRVDGREIKQEFGSYVRFLESLGELEADELDVSERYQPWFREVESTGMTKSYKMVVLLAMLQRGKGDWYKPITHQEVAPFFHKYFTEKEFRRKIDFSDRKTAALAEYNVDEVAQLIRKMPMTKWSNSSQGLVCFDGTYFWFDLDVEEDLEQLLYEWTIQICSYRLHAYFERKWQVKKSENAV
ncbi:MAG: DEAD/DEAH box helicase family protein [Firmicutes bacterium]|nr:DEAD/DEAH box helicase family protein [Bacillota bacterium]